MMEPRKLLQAYVDGELDPAATLELEAALAADPTLRAAHERLRALSGAIREKADYHAAPRALSERIRAGLPEEKKLVARKPFLPAFAFATLAVALIGVALVLQRPSDDERLAAELLSSHARATIGQRMIDVASSDQHTVKPWLSARLPFSPPVTDLAAKGFPLDGGRVDYVGGRPVAVLVYQRRKHMIEVFIWPAAGEGKERLQGRDGLNMESFARGGMRYWLVSDLDREELRELAELL